MGSELDKLASVGHVVVKVVLVVRVLPRHVSRVADGGLHEASSSRSCLDAKPHVVRVVESVKDAEDVDAALNGLLAELVDHVVGVVGVAYGVRAAQEHLERHVRDLLAQRLEAVPRAFFEESHGNVEGRAAPHFEGKGIVAQGEACRGRSCQEVRRAHPGCEQGLVRVAPGRVRHQDALVLPHRLGKSFGALLGKDFPPARALALVRVRSAVFVDSRFDQRHVWGDQVWPSDGHQIWVGTERGRVAVHGEVSNVTKLLLTAGSPFLRRVVVAGSPG
mmetsp:Transcript_6728/g.19599  ORF Transcript_6728/g.19599 Transcript_6728/m.19599 type:complete len:276 (-) Transcript_6728:1262-2089(-)